MNPVDAVGRGHWLGTLKARLMIASVLVIACSVLGSASVLLARVEARAVQAVLDLEADHIEQLTSLVGQRVVAMQNMLRATADAMPPAARGDVAAALAFLGDKPALRVSFDTVFLADAAGRVLALGDGNQTLPSALNLSGRDYFFRTVSQGVPVVSSPIVGRESIGRSRLNHSIISSLNRPRCGSSRSRDVGNESGSGTTGIGM